VSYERNHRGTLAERLARRSERVGDCLVWQGTKGNADGHGRINDHGVSRWTHRVAWEIAYGPIPTGKFVCHKCDNPPCIEPTHLFLGTAKDNSKDMAQKDRSRFGERATSVRLTAELVSLTKKWLSEGVSRKAIAETLGVSYMAIADIDAGRTWRRVV
jgi:hypothetical protein